MSWQIRPGADECAPFYHAYVAEVPDGDVLAFLTRQREDMAALVAAVPPDREVFRYAPGKWSITQVVGHLVDTERLFGFRALWFARGESSALPGMDEDLWGETAQADRLGLVETGRHLATARQATLDLFASLPAEAIERKGVAGDRPVTVRALAWIIGGHAHHHLAVLRDRYRSALDL